MRKNISAVLLLAVCFFGLAMFGCSGQTPQEFADENNLGMATDTSEIAACFAWMKEKEQAERTQYDSLAPTDKGYALMHRDTMSMIKSVWGKEQNVCKPGTNGWDAYIATKQEEGKTKRQYSADLASTAKFGIVTTGAVKLADSLMGAAGDKIAGNKIQSGRDSINADGDANIKGNTNEQLTKTDSNVQVAREGDNQYTRPADPTAEDVAGLKETEAQ